MAKSRNAVKRCGGGKRPRENFAAQLRRQMDADLRDCADLGKIYQEEMMLIALKRMGVLGPKRIIQLDETMKEVRRQYLKLSTEDSSPEGNNDKEISYTKGKFDEELEAAVGPENFIIWEVRRNLDIHSDGLRTIAVRRFWDRQQQEMKRKLQELEEAQNARAKMKEALENGI